MYLVIWFELTPLQMVKLAYADVFCTLLERTLGRVTYKRENHVGMAEIWFEVKLEDMKRFQDTLEVLKIACSTMDFAYMFTKNYVEFGAVRPM